MTEEDQAAVAQRIREKFDFYLVALAFTILGLAVQTAKFGVLVWADVFEMTGWMCLLVSGVVGLSRMEWSAHAHHVHAMRDSNKKRLSQVQQGIALGGTFVSSETGKPVSAQQEVGVATQNIATISVAIENLDKHLTRRYWVQRISFLAGSCALLLARGLAGMSAWW
jgi:hypothetical protein